MTVESKPEGELIPRQHYRLGTIEYCCRLILDGGVSFRGIPRVLSIFFPHQAVVGEVPHATTGRFWLLRLGYHKLHRPKQMADDWAWLVDHTVQVGPEKCLAIAGVRLSALPSRGTCLGLENLEPFALLPVETSNGEVVHEQLENIAKAHGVPREILSDEGSDLRKGIRAFCSKHPTTLARVDLPHKAARLLKRLLEKEDRWQSFLTQVGQVKPKIRQTELAHLMPPQQRTKARYMNLGMLLQWGTKTLGIIDNPPAQVLAHCTSDRLDEKLGWLRAYRHDLERWSRLQQLTQTAISYVRSEGYSARALVDIPKRLDALAQSADEVWLRDQLVDFVREQCTGLREDERLVGSTEILESSFGKLKNLENGHQQGGFTSLILMWAAMLGKTTTQTIREAMISTPTKLVERWLAKHLGTTVPSKRRIAYSAASAPEKSAET